ncbi:MAG: enoyl-CoA hydratase-related protein [Betaproteobacteria bacterium]
MKAQASLRGDVAIVTLDNPPVNSLSQDLRETLLACLQAAEAQTGVSAVVLVGARRMFCGGADIRALDTPAYWAHPRTVDLAAFIDGMSKPVVAAVEGLAMGGGLELAMGCHWRVVEPGARLALPEVRLGLLPGGGGTFRLPRLIGVEAATAMMLSGDAVTGRRSAEIGLADIVAEGPDVLHDALAFARSLRSRDDRLRRARDLPVQMQDAGRWFAEQRDRQASREVQGPAARTILDCIESGVTQSVEEATRVAAEGTRMLSTSKEFRALRHLFFAERQAGRVAEVAPPAKQRIRAVALLGTALDGWRTLLDAAGIDLASASPDLVLLSSPDEATRAAWREAQAGWPRAVPVASVGDHEAWQRWRTILPDRTLLGLCLTGERLVQFAHEPGVEAALRDAVASLVRRVGKVCVPCLPTPGFIVSRLSAAAVAHGGAETPEGRRAMAREGQALLAQGIALRADDIDVALVTGGGFPSILGGPLYHASHHAN